MGDREMVSEHLPMLYRMAWMLTGNEADAQDLAHDAMVSALTSLSRFRGKSRLSTWLSAILINRHRTCRRAEATRTAAAQSSRSRLAWRWSGSKGVRTRPFLLTVAPSVCRSLLSWNSQPSLSVLGCRCSAMSIRRPPTAD